MVIPMMSPAGSIDELPDEVRPVLVKVKYCVVGLWVFGLLFFFFEPIGSMSTICLAVFGTFLLSEDPQMARCYGFLREGLGQCCGNGGLSMLTPFLVFSLVNSVVDGLQLAQLFSYIGREMLCLPPVDILICIWVCEFASAVFSWRVLKAVLPPMPEPGNGYQPLPGRLQSAPPSATGSRGDSQANRGGFQPFSGEGHRLAG